ncbi:putative transcriptional regulatory protein dep1 protein [Phaeoacremonium minimum UCRPA7]|uniref:Putative transcriptional regulatory protein dep1 protein n=1 Tax=Phaeoacremonium minimum (strain UCR-PA7) TaxID=1286976 RepID=R8BD61_PHAM7|nr:putative transcriptional regulatory protein dep1 protein [Phaeoacremonium minimum UCRPA7]EON97249.1 putative transcriptional regulatory protein dep1 protein [Phaeoacremonium minimum UCRPA7]
MATGDTAVSIHLANRPPVLAEPSDSNISSPLSDVEDKDADGEDMDIDLNNGHADEQKHGDHESDDGGGSASHAASDDEDDDSNLSEVDVNDSEAETERLYDTPRKNTDIRDTVVISSETVNGGTPTTRERIFERSPSKLQQQIQADVDAENAREDDEDDDDELSDEPDDEDRHDDNSSVAPSEAESDHEAPVKAKKMSLSPEKQDEIVAQSTIVEDVLLDSAEETRKRKRSPTAEVSESDQPLRKRTGSVAAPGKTSPTIDHSVKDDELLDTSTNDHSGEHSGDEDAEDLASKDKPEDVAQSVENVPTETTRSKKPKRNGGKKRKGSDEEDSETLNQDAQPADEAVATDEHNAEEENAEAEHDEEAEAAQRNEEELERKRAAFEQLTAIEKHFAAFRDRLYEERLAQLNEEEAMLTSESPTHPEYLAMMHCIDARRDERLRVVDVEYKLNMEALERWAVARRAQILSQFYQSIRESREKVLEELGRQWYEIQHERRRYAANSIPDYGIRFPVAKAQQKRHAIAHSKEVSILSGIARHEGFPAAPEMKGATVSEVDEDLEAITQPAS